MTTFVKIATAMAIAFGTVSGTAAAGQDNDFTFLLRHQNPFGNGNELGSSSTGLYNPGGSPADNWELTAFGPVSPRTRSDLIPQR